MVGSQILTVGQDDKEWRVLVMLLVDRMEKWWASVMDVGSDPELSKMVHVLGSSYSPNREGI